MSRFKITIGAILLATTLFSIPLTLQLTNNNSNIALKAAGSNATLTLAGNVSPAVSQEFDAFVLLNADAATVRGVDMNITFDPQKLTLLDIVPATGSAFKTFMPLDSSNQFSSINAVNSANTTGKIVISALTIDMTAATLSSPFAGTGQLASLHFKAIQEGQTLLSFYFIPGSSTTSTIITDSTPPVNILTQPSQLANLLINISLPTPTPTIALIATVTPNPLPTPGISVSSSPILLTRQIALSADDVNEDGTKFDTANSSLWIGTANNISASFTGLRFNAISIPNQSVITDAHLEIKSSRLNSSSWSVLIGADALANSPPFTVSNKPSSRSLLNRKLSYTDNSKWQNGSWYSINGMGPLIQDVVSQTGWNSGNSLSLIFKGTSGKGLRDFVSSFDGNPLNGAKLIITYTPPVSSSSPTASPTPIPPSPTPTPKPTLTPTPTLLPTPTPTGTATELILQIASSGNDANEDAMSLDLSSNLWLGNGSTATGSYTGLRYTSIPIPQGATIKSAYLKIHTPTTTWISLNLQIAAESNGNSPAFSSTNLLSQRVLTTSVINHSSDVQWVANTWNDLEQMTPVIQEIVKRTDWKSGNSLSIIMKGTGTAWGRIFIDNFDSNPSLAPELVVSYY